MVKHLEVNVCRYDNDFYIPSHINTVLDTTVSRSYI